MPAEWTLEDAETKFRELYNAARTGEPQFIQEDGKVEAVILAAAPEMVDELSPENFKSSTSLAEFLLTIPKGDWMPDENVKSLKLRDVEF